MKNKNNNRNEKVIEDKYHLNLIKNKKKYIQILVILSFDTQKNDKEKNNKNISSENSEIKIDSSKRENNFFFYDNKLAFIKPFNNLLEDIFISLIIHYPLIIEVGTGKGKKSTFYYIANILWFKVIIFLKIQLQKIYL